MCSSDLQQNNASLTLSGNTHWTPNKAKAISQRVLTTVQCKRMYTHSLPISQHKGKSRANKVPQLSNCFPQAYTIPLPYFLRTLTSTFLPKFPHYYLIPKRLFFICIAPTPFAEESLIEQSKALHPPGPLFSCLNKLSTILPNEVFSLKPHLPIENLSESTLISI